MSVTEEMKHELSDERLLPCPFCGGPAVLTEGENGVSAHCTLCPTGTAALTREEAANAWNSRRTPSPEPTEAEVEAALGEALSMCETYADFIRRVPTANIEEHPYLPELEGVIERLRTLRARPAEAKAGMVKAEPAIRRAIRAIEAMRTGIAVHNDRFGHEHPIRGPVVTELIEAGKALSALEPVAEAKAEPVATLQERVAPWMQACFGPEISADRLERSDRFIEEALELVQASDYPKERALALVDYVYGRDQGEINQEVGGVMITLAAHCLAHGVDMHAAAETELARIWTKIDKIRAKQAAKPTGSALPVASPVAQQRDEVIEECAKAALGDQVNDRRAADPDHPDSDYAAGRVDAAAAIRALSPERKDQSNG